MIIAPSPLVPIVLRKTHRNRHFVSRERSQANLTALIDNPRVIEPPKRTPRGVRVTQERSHGWPVFRMTPTSRPVRGKFIYCHGGSYVNSIHAWHWKLIASIVKRTGAEALVPMYRLVPEGGTAAEAAQTGVKVAQDAGEDTILMGDSAGAQVAFSIAAGLRDRGVTAPLTVLISPPIDLELVNPRLPERADLDPWLCRDGLLLYTELWAGEGGFGTDLNPINTDVRGLGPMLIFSGTLDILNLDAADWVSKMRSAGVDVEFHEVDGQVHVYPILPTLPGLQARRRIVERVRAAIASN